MLVVVSEVLIGGRSSGKGRLGGVSKLRVGGKRTVFELVIPEVSCGTCSTGIRCGKSVVKSMISFPFEHIFGLLWSVVYCHGKVY